MITLKRTTSQDIDFQNLVRELDKDLAIRDGDEHDFFHQFNKIDMLRHVVVAYKKDAPVGCGAIKPYDNVAIEVKRMFVPLEHRGSGVAVAVLHELEHWAKELGFGKCILETGIKMPEAIGLYKKSGYSQTDNYGQYAGVASSVCFEKSL
ncbi:GNAT family N-acetyltransferase [Flavobacterium sp. MFBS3-15]|uniref:GNAT family N-acetyltransferase n=1 Tax=Flavobacterium sp. MFBS3-15 TaxID=2989816 RepID=UPI0022367992|nr:GNAT family N-acetyltransferase [Flavobacterium sp. MFBS3-15]MCW4468224.1 GNAT family N-acetyltransferase [Flavobacterium sp. MFBS3-15]